MASGRHSDQANHMVSVFVNRCFNRNVRADSHMYTITHVDTVCVVPTCTAISTRLI